VVHLPFLYPGQALMIPTLPAQAVAINADGKNEFPLQIRLRPT
jgi:hypothetical protein